MAKLWTFEKKEKLNPFAAVLRNAGIPFQLLSANMKEDEVNGLTVSVEEDYFEDARRLLINYRRKNTNRNRK